MQRGMRPAMALNTRVALVVLMSTRQSRSPSTEISNDHGVTQMAAMSSTGSTGVAELKNREQLCWPRVVA